jgi:nucleoside triphosphate diphosphatase
VGFDWPDAAAVLDKLHEEVAELEAEIEVGDKAAARDELGDLLFVCANLARKLDIDPEDALRASNAKFTRRFGYIEDRLRDDGRAPEDSTLEEMEDLWLQAKTAERARPKDGAV